jgi:hypothetical protein
MLSIGLNAWCKLVPRIAISSFYFVVTGVNDS